MTSTPAGLEPFKVDRSADDVEGVVREMLVAGCQLRPNWALSKQWIGIGNREVQTLPVLNLRESATQMGLMRLWLNPWSTQPGAALHRARTM